MNTKIGFIGQGFVGKNYADDFERRGYTVARYALEEPYCNNRDAIAECSVVIIAVPTPTTPEGFDPTILERVIPLTAPGTAVVIKSTVVPGTTYRLQDQFHDRIICFSPEFLSEKTAVEDAAHPIMNIIGMVRSEDMARGHEVLALFPESLHNEVVDACQAELIKYAHNIQGYLRIVYANMLYESAEAMGIEWEPIGRAMDADPMLSPYYNHPIHNGGRGAGGNCFIKDFAAFKDWYASIVPDEKNMAVWEALERKNLALLKGSNKSMDILRSVYGDQADTAL